MNDTPMRVGSSPRYTSKAMIELVHWQINVMSCALCYTIFKDEVKEQQCHIICGSHHTVCKTCLLLLQGDECPICRGPRMTDPNQVPMDIDAEPQPHSQPIDYSYSSLDDACIGPEALVTVRRGNWVTVPMKEVMPGDIIEDGKIKWIIRVSNLNRDKPIPLYNGVTVTHPVRGRDGRWIDVSMTHTNVIVYNVVMEDRSAGSIKVDGFEVAVVGYPVPGMVHSYWDSRRVIEDIQARYPEGGFVDVDAKKFQHTNGLVSGIFDSFS